MPHDHKLVCQSVLESAPWAHPAPSDGPPRTVPTTKKVKPTQTQRAEPQPLRLSELVPLPAGQSAPDGSRGVTMHFYLA